MAKISSRQSLINAAANKHGIYQYWKDGKITHRNYCQMKEDYERQTEAINEVVLNLQEEKTALENGINTESPFLAAFREYENITKLTRDILIEWVDHIKIYKSGNISIKLKFANEYRRIT